MPVTKADKNLDGLRFALLADLLALPFDSFLCIDEKLIDTPSLIYCQHSNFFVRSYYVYQTYNGHTLLHFQAWCYTASCSACSKCFYSQFRINQNIGLDR